MAILAVAAEVRFHNALKVKCPDLHGDKAH